MQKESDLLSKSVGRLKAKYREIKFAMFGFSLAAPGIVLGQCQGSCTNCYGCIVSGIPAILLVLLVIARKLGLNVLVTNLLKPYTKMLKN